MTTPTIEILQDFSQRVERLGCKLSIDDAGTGFGTLTHLRNLNVSQLKIDMSFVRGVLRSETDRGIVRSIVMIAGELNLATVAEGVESRDVLAELRRLGVDYAQGFLLGEPRPVGPSSA